VGKVALGGPVGTLALVAAGAPATVKAGAAPRAVSKLANNIALGCMENF